MSKRRSISPAKTATRKFRSYVGFFYDIRPPISNATIAGERSIFGRRDFFESLQDRGRTSPAAKSALSHWGDAAGIDIHHSNPTLSIVTSTESGDPPKNAPEMTTGAVSKLERVESYPEVPAINGLCAATVILMTYARIRFSDVHHIREFDMPIEPMRNHTDANGESVFGTWATSKTRKTHGLALPWACPKIGIGRTPDWVKTLCNFLDAPTRKNGRYLSFPPRPNRLSGSESISPSASASSRRELAFISAA